jgi:NDP-sugar pyrophosphorylase family protein
VRAGIIAAGWGERLGQKTPKALTSVGGRALIDYTLDGLEAAGATSVTCIVNEAARAVPEHVAKSGRKLKMDWIVQTTPSSMHSFLIVLERLAASPGQPPSPSGRGTSAAQGEAEEPFYFLTTVDSVGPPAAYSEFAQTCSVLTDADVCLGLTTHIDDEKPLRVAMRGEEGTGIMPARVTDNPKAFEIIAMTNNGFDSEYVTAGFYGVSPRILKEKDKALAGGFSALRQYLGYLLKYGYRFYGIPLPPVVDVDRPQDVQAAERFLQETTCS